MMITENPLFTVVDYLLAKVKADFSNVAALPDGSYTAQADTFDDYERFVHSKAVLDIAPITYLKSGAVHFKFRLPDNFESLLDVPPPGQDYHCSQSVSGRSWIWRVTFAADPDSTRIIIGEGRVKSMDIAMEACRRAVTTHRKNGGAK